MSYKVFDTSAEAIEFARAMGETAYYTDSGGKLPRCDGPRWGDPNVHQNGGKHSNSKCTCPARDRPVATCPYITTTHAKVWLLPDGTYGINIVDAETQAMEDEAPTVDGKSVPLGFSDSRTITSAEDTGRRAYWDGSDLL